MFLFHSNFIKYYLTLSGVTVFALLYLPLPKSLVDSEPVNDDKMYLLLVLLVRMYCT